MCGFLEISRFPGGALSHVTQYAATGVFASSSYIEHRFRQSEELPV